jgi:hypothetical protein
MGVRDREPHIDRPFSTPPACSAGVNGSCDTLDRDKTLQPAAPVRECPADSSMVTVRPGARYCIPNHPLRD